MTRPQAEHPQAARTTGTRAVVDPACATCHGTGQVNGHPCGPCSLLLTPKEIALLYGERVPDAPAQS